MSTSQRSFDQVKSILGKLDRDIDAARTRRLGDGPAPARTPAQPLTPADAYIGRASVPGTPPSAARPVTASAPPAVPAVNPSTGRMVATRIQRRPDQHGR